MFGLLVNARCTISSEIVDDIKRIKVNPHFYPLLRIRQV